MTQRERMDKGMLYNPGADEIMNEQFPYLDRLGEFNNCSSSDVKGREALMKELFAECGENCYIPVSYTHLDVYKRQMYMSEKIEIMGISVEKCYAEDIMESINQHWYEDTLATYGVITMKLLIAAQKDEELKEYIETLDKAVADEPEIVEAAGLQDEAWEKEISEHGFFGTLFWLLNLYKNRIFILGEREEDTAVSYTHLDVYKRQVLWKLKI